MIAGNIITPETYAVVDVETTIFQKGNPYASRNKLCYVGILGISGVRIWQLDGFGKPYADQLAEIYDCLRYVDCIVGFNLKFDLAWLKRYGIDLSDKIIWDCQLCEFLQNSQTPAYPSLAGACERLSLPAKIDTIDEYYWKNGIDTPQIPEAEMREYLNQDLESTNALYLWQREHLHPSQRALFQAQCDDLLCLLEMEWNGMRFDEVGLQEKSNELAQQMESIRSEIMVYTDNWPHFGLNSGLHLSCLLFGGEISVDVGTPYEHTYKGGAKAGQTETRHRWETVTKTYPRLFEPKEDWKLNRQGDYWSTDANEVLRHLPKHKLVKLLLEYSEVEKLKSTYTDALLKIRDKMDWQDGYVHGQYNQVVAVTGRLSSNNPNMQNMPELINEFIVTRFT